MSDKLLVNVDYLTRKTTASLVFVGLETGYLPPITARVFDEQGVVNQEFALNKVTGQNFVTTFKGTEDFGLRISSAGYDTAIYNTDLSGVYYSDLYTHWPMTDGFGDNPSAIGALVSGSSVIPRSIDKRNNVYLNTPLLITRGDAVYHGRIATVVSGNYLTFTNDRSLASYTGYNLDNSIIQVLSGASSGQTFAITDYTQGSQIATVDRNCYSLSGQIVKIMPYRTINGYSGWQNYVLNLVATGQGGIKTRFNLSEQIPNKIGSLHYTSGTFSGTSTIRHPLDINSFFDLGAVSVVALKNDTYYRDIRSGDLIFYNPASSPSSTSTGIILQTSTHAVTGQGDIAVKFWPTGTPYTGSTYTIYRGNHFEVQSFPNFDSNYMLAISAATGAVLETPFHTPSAEVEMTANEFESTFSTVPATAHYHFGPIRLSNGQILDDNVTMTGQVPPYLRFSGQVLNGDPTTPSLTVSKTAFSTQNPNIGHNFNGMYYKDGVFVIAAETSFNASETLICKAEIAYGSNKITRVFTIPVQPAI